MTRLAPLFALLVLAAACGSSSKQVGNRTLSDQERYEHQKVFQARGWTKSEVKQVIGSPGRKDSEMIGGRELERWSYPKRSIDVYFDEDGFLVRWRAPFG